MSRQDLRDLEVVDGYLNIKDDAWFQQQFNNSAEEQAAAQQFETDFIDSVYGTEGGRWEGDGLPTALPGMEDARIDLMRVVPDGVKVGSPDHYEALTSGTIDWAEYASDEAYIKAYKDLHPSGKGNSNSIDELMGLDQDNSSHGTEEDRLAFIEDADAGGAARGDYNSGSGDEDSDWDNDPKNPNSWWNKWDNKYTHEEDPNADVPKPEAAFTPSSDQKPQTYTLKDDKGNVYHSASVTDSEGNFMTTKKKEEILKPSEPGSRRNTRAAAARAGITIRRHNVTRPANIPADWGPIQ